jgi:hypothetical protein
MSISVYGGGDKGGRETAGEKSHIGSRKAKRDDDDDDHKKRQKLNPMGIPDLYSMGSHCSICFDKFSKEEIKRQTEIEKLGYDNYKLEDVNKYGYPHLPNIIRLNSDGIYYHRGCLCVNCHGPIEKNKMHIMFQVCYDEFSTIPYNCECLLKLDEESKGRLMDLTGTGIKIGGNKTFPPWVKTIFDAPFHELIDFLGIWGNYFNQDSFHVYENYWEKLSSEGKIPKAYSKMQLAEVIMSLN